MGRRELGVQSGPQRCSLAKKQPLLGKSQPRNYQLSGSIKGSSGGHWLPVEKDAGPPGDEGVRGGPRDVVSVI